VALIFVGMRKCKCMKSTVGPKKYIWKNPGTCKTLFWSDEIREN
jgi:hypothetical protein